MIGGNLAGSVTEDTLKYAGALSRTARSTACQGSNNAASWGETGGTADYLVCRSNAEMPVIHISPSGSSGFTSNSLHSEAYQTFATVPGTHYTISFDLWGVAGGNTRFGALFGDTVLVSTTRSGEFGTTHYSFDVVATGTSTTLKFVNDWVGSRCQNVTLNFNIDNVAVTAQVVPEQQKTDGVITFTDAEANETHTVTFVPQNGGAGYLGTFTLDPLNQSDNSIGWHFAVDNSLLKNLAPGEVHTQVYLVTVTRPVWRHRYQGGHGHAQSRKCQRAGDHLEWRGAACDQRQRKRSRSDHHCRQ